MIKIFTDGSSRGNPGPGGWGAVVVDGDTVTELGGAERNTTNNRMELMAAIKGLEVAAENSSIVIYTDSRYIINGITSWIHAWKRNDWQTKSKEDVLNRDLWETLHALTDKHTIKWEYVGGHVGIVGNERCDEIATAMADGEEPKLFKGSLKNYDRPNILDISHDLALVATKKSSGSRSKSPAYSYVSAVNGKIEVHKTWAECEKRVKGTRGARFKKALNAGEEASLKEEFK